MADWNSPRVEAEDVFISHSDFQNFPRGEANGCCGLDGAHKNIVDPETMEPVAFEFADCWSSHYIHFTVGDYELTEESPEPPVCLSGCVRLNGKICLAGAACGRDEREARKRLDRECHKYLEREASGSSHNRKISKFPVQTTEAAEFLEQFKKKKQPKWLCLKY